ncbi:hypothetical protein NIES2101_03470 [Calothrix sp. HK-06]|nr:hypothetical protein NIES2101_03470 [Calothrix sp. HK-06]
MIPEFDENGNLPPGVHFCEWEFEKTIAAMEQDEERKRHNYQKWEMGRGAAQCHLDKLRAEIAEYENVNSS